MGFKFILEYSNDDRGSNSTDIFQNDLFLGSRINLNDVRWNRNNSNINFRFDGNGNTGNIEVSTRLRET